MARRKTSIDRTKQLQTRPPPDDDGGGFIDHRQLRHFLAVVEHGRFGRAAEAAGISKQALSQSIAALEDALGAKLFERGQFGAVPTEFAEVLKTHAAAIQNESRKARWEIAGLKQEHQGDVTFAVGAAFSEIIAPLAIRRFVDANPQVRVKVANVHPDNMLAMLERGELDFVVMGDFADGELGGGLSKRTLFTMNGGLYCASTHPLTNIESPSVRDLRGFRWISVWRTNRVRRFIEDLVTTNDEPEEPEFIFCDNFAVSRALVIDHECLILGNRFFFDREVQSNTLCEIRLKELNLRVTYALYTRKAVGQSRAAQALMDEIIRSAMDRFADSIEIDPDSDIAAAELTMRSDIPLDAGLRP